MSSCWTRIGRELLKREYDFMTMWLSEAEEKKRMGCPRAVPTMEYKSQWTVGGATRYC